MNLYQNIQDAFMRVVISVERKVESSEWFAWAGRPVAEHHPLRLRSPRRCDRRIASILVPYRVLLIMKNELRKERH